MPVLVAVGIGAAAGAVAVGVGASVGAAVIVGGAAAIIAHESGAAGWVFDNVVEPVGKAVADTVKAVFDNPIEAIAKIAAVATGNAWAIPLIDGASTLAQGGDIGDALKATAISYVGGKIGGTVGEVAGDVVAKATGSELASTVIGAGAGKAATAIVMGQDPVQAFISGGINAGVSAAAGWLTEQTEGAFAKLPPSAQNIITKTIGTAVSSAATGQPITAEAVWNAVLTSKSVTEAVSGFIGNNTNLDDAQVGALTAAVTRTAAAAFGGGDIPAAIRSSLDSYGTSEFKKWFDNTSAGTSLNNTLDKITGDYQVTENLARKLEGTRIAYDSAYANYSNVIGQINSGVAEEQRLKGIYERALQNFQANENQANADALKAAVDSYNAYVNNFNADYTNNLKPALDRYQEQVGTLERQFNTDLDAYNRSVLDLETSSERLNADLTPLYTEIDKTFVEFMNPDFNEAEYRQIAGLAQGEDAYLHWLREGKDQGLPTNAADYQAAYNDARQRAIMGAIERTGMDVADVNPQQLQDFISYIDQNYGGDLTRLRNAPLQTLADKFSTDYTANQRRIQAIDEERADVRQLMDAWTGGQSIGIAPVITDQVNELLVAAGRQPGLVGEDMVQADFDALERYSNRLTSDAAPLRDTVADFAPTTATNDEIAAGIAKRIIDPDTGLMEWSNIDFQTPFWSPELGEMVYQQSIPIFDKVDQNSAVKGYPEGIYGPAEGGKPTGNYAYIYKNLAGEWVGGVRYQPVSGVFDTPAGKTLVELKDTAPVQFIEQTAALTGDAAQTVANVVGDAVVEFSRNAVEYARESDSDFVKDTAAVVIGGTGELMKSVNDMLLLTKVNPESTPLGQWARDMIALSGDVQSDAYRDAVQRMNTRFAEATADTNGNTAAEIGESAKAIWGAFSEAPGYFLAEYIAKELVQELPGAALGAITGGAATLGMAAARRAAIEVSQEAGRAVAQRAALTGIVALDMAESIGGSAGQGFDTAYQEALAAGMSDADATEFAYNTAVTAGMTGGLITALSMGALDGNAMERVIADRVTGSYVKDATNALLDQLARGAEVMVKEGIQETLEEGAVEAVIASNIVQINPDYDVAGNIALNAMLGGIAGVGTAGGVYSADRVANAIATFNPTVNRIISEAPKTAEGANTAANALRDAGITNDATLLQLSNRVFDQGFVTPEEAALAFKASAGYTPTADELAQFTGQRAQNDVAADVAAYVDPRYVDIDEVKAAAAAEGVTLTDEQAAAYVGQRDEAQATADIRQEYDPQATTAQEAREFFASLGYTPTTAEVSQFVGPRAETEVQADVGTYVNPRQVTDAEARKFFADRGYTPTDAEVQQFIGQGAEDFEATAPARVEEYVDPRYVSEDEVRAAYATLGLARPTQADIEALVGQYSEADLTGRAEENLPAARYNSIVEQIEQLSVGSGPEVLEALEAVKADLQSQMESLGFKFDEATGEMLDAIAASEERLLDTIAANEEAGMARDEAIQDALTTIADDLGTTTETLLERIGETEESLNTRVDELATELGNVETAILDRVQELEDAGTARDEALQTALDEIAADVGTTREDLLDRLGETEQSFADRIAEATTGLEERIGDVETSILDRVQELEDSGVARDEALGTAISELATELGTTEESLLDQIGATEQSLLDTLAEATTGLEERIGDVETSILDRVQELEDSGVARDEALQTAIDEVAGDVGATREELLAQLGETEQSLLDQLGAVETGLQEQLGGVETAILDRVQELEDSGIARDEALGTAIDELAGDLGTTREELLTQIGATEQSLLDEIGATEERLTTGFTDAVTALANQAAAYEAAGIARDEALSQAIDDVSTDLGTTRTELLTQLGQTEQSLLGEIGITREDLLTQLGQTETTLRSDMQAIADLIGKPVGEVTDVDIDFVADLLAQQEALTTFTPEQLLYDVTGDQQITQDDLDLLLQIQQGAPVQIAAESKFAPTGLYAQTYQGQVQQALDAQAALEQQQQMEQNIQQQLQTARQQANVGAMWNLLSQQQDLYGQRVDVRTPDPLQLRYLYDFSSIFATPQQASMFPSPYAEGGQVEAVNDTLLKLLRGP